MRQLLLLLLTSIAPVMAQPRDASSPVVLETHIRPHIAFLTQQQGRSGAGAERAAGYIRDHYQKLGLKPLFENGSYYQPIPGRDQVMGRNVGAIVKGTDPKLRDEFIIVSAHYDHLGVKEGFVFPGADDNASGVSMTLELARWFVKHPPKRSIAFVNFDLEERMLWGSRWFANHPPVPLERVKLFITADMIGRSLGGLPLPTVFVLGSEHAPRVKESLDAAETPDGLETSRLGIDLIGSIPRSDYGPFKDRKIPFLFFSTGEHPDYHSVRDTLARLDVAKVARVSEYIRQVVQHAANAAEPPQWVDQPPPDLDEAKTLRRITQLLLEQADERLGELQRATVSYIHNKTGQILERGEMTRSERTWLTRMSQVLLFSVL